MSRFFGPARQNGYVVRDIERAMQFWSETLGVGPFYVLRNIEFRNFHYRGQPSRPPVITVAFANSGDLQIELIQQHNDAPSAYREFLSAGREGMQHISSWFSDHGEYDRARAALLDRGLSIVHESLGGEGSGRFAYFETGVPEGHLIEVSETLLPGIREIVELVASEAAGWDGENPIRTIVPNRTLL